MVEAQRHEAARGRADAPQAGVVDPKVEAAEVEGREGRRRHWDN